MLGDSQPVDLEQRLVAARVEAPVPAPKKPVDKSQKILLADDQDFNLVAINQAIESLKIPLEVVCVADGQSAIDEVEKNDKKTFALILLDHNMPQKTGLQVLEAISKIYEDANTPLPRTVFLSAFIDDELKRKGKAAGVHDFVEKPLTNKRLRAICEEINILPQV